MVHFCAVPGCSNQSNREVDRSYFGLPLHNKVLLKTWIHKIGRVNLPINANTRICSDHFVSAAKRKLQPDEYLTLSLPVRSHTTTIKPIRPPTARTIPEPLCEDNDEEASVVVETSDVQLLATSMFIVRSTNYNVCTIILFAYIFSI